MRPAGEPDDPEPQNWRDLAACRGMDTRLFFTRRGDNHSVERAKSICETCTVRQQCGAISLHEKYGIWAALSEKQRRRVRRRPMTRGVDPTPKTDAPTKAEVLRARGDSPPGNEDPPTPERPEHDWDDETPAAARCRHCNKELPAGWHRAYCDDQCMNDHDRASRRARASSKPKITRSKPAARNGKRPAAEPTGPILNGVGTVLAEVLAITGVGEVELEVAGTRLLVRPRA